MKRSLKKNSKITFFSNQFNNNKTTVSRIHCNGENYGIDLILDVNVDIYKVVIGEKLSLALSSTLSSDTDVRFCF